MTRKFILFQGFLSVVVCIFSALTFALIYHDKGDSWYFAVFGIFFFLTLISAFAVTIYIGNDQKEFLMEFEELVKTKEAIREKSRKLDKYVQIIGTHEAIVHYNRNKDESDPEIKQN